MQKVHGVKECAPPPKQACTYCRDQKTRCQGGPPCSKCVYRGIDCSLSRQTEVQPGGDSSCPPDTLLSDHSAHSKTSRSEKERHFLDLYFKLFHPHWPFIHQGSFREDDETPLLVQSMIVIGLWVSKEPNAQSKAVDLHNVLNSAIHQQKVCNRNPHYNLVYSPDQKTRRKYGMLLSQKTQVVPVPGRYRPIKLSCSI